MQIRTLSPADIDMVLALCNEAKQTLAARGIDQWQSGFPDRESLLGDLEGGKCFAFFDEDGTLAAMTCLSTAREPEYDTLQSGAWLTQSLPYATTHRTMVASRFRSTGLSDRLFEEAERRAKEKGCGSIRVDTHRDNSAMRALILRHGYTECCTFLLPYPDSSPERIGYEKII